ncbi:hypothetical protein [Caballeronia sp. GAFFF2]|uniref:hypothetical protein n=2 Tax=unclassified Caballeronia TaxID=2646786 RepID=UPI0020291C3E|nr:hypothetical protein [Caballeronia sp. GAFFF2]
MTRKYILLLLIGFLSLSSGSIMAEGQYEVQGDAIRLFNHATTTQLCKLDAPAIYATETYDEAAIIVSGRGYVEKKDLEDCSDNKKIHVHNIPGHVGVLTDVNVEQKLYVALDFVTVQPYTWLATIAKLGTSKNLVSLRGAYIPRQSLSNMKKFSFGGSGDAGSSIISLDGKFVAPNGEVGCEENSYPGVWDILKNERVVTDSSACSSLFGKKPK